MLSHIHTDYKLVWHPSYMIHIVSMLILRLAPSQTDNKELTINSIIIKLTFLTSGSLAKQTKQFEVYYELLPQLLVGQVAWLV